VAARVVARWGGVAIDPFLMSLSRPELSMDGQHYVRGADTQDDPVYMQLAQAIAHFACGGST
jgi:hypothetical protein